LDDLFNSLQAAEVELIIGFRFILSVDPDQFVINESMLEGDFRGCGGGRALVDPAFVDDDDVPGVGQRFIGRKKSGNARPDDQKVAAQVGVQFFEGLRIGDFPV